MVQSLTAGSENAKVYARGSRETNSPGHDESTETGLAVNDWYKADDKGPVLDSDRLKAFSSQMKTAGSDTAPSKAESGESRENEAGKESKKEKKRDGLDTTDKIVDIAGKILKIILLVLPIFIPIPIHLGE